MKINFSLRSRFRWQAMVLMVLVALLVASMASPMLGQPAPPENLATPIFEDTNPSVIPTEKTQYWDFAIAGIAPLIVLGLKKTVPKIPKWVLPTITPVIGIILGLALNGLAGANLGWVDMAKAGALAVFVREALDQSLKAAFTPSEE